MSNPFNKLTRRQFLNTSAAVGTQLALMTVPSWMREAAANAQSKSGESLVVMMLRGAADGLNMVVPYSDPAYRKARPTIGLNAPGKKNGVLDLDGQFGLHPAMKALLPLYKEKNLAFVHAAGSPDPTRSHFDAQDYMESGTPGVKRTDTGWLNRALLNEKQKAMNPLSAVAISPQLPRILRGEFPVANMTSAKNHRFMQGRGAEQAFLEMYENSIDQTLGSTGKQARESVKELRAILGSENKSLAAGYSQDALHKNFADMAMILKADAGTRVGFLDMGGWDHHVNEGAEQGQMASMAGNLSDAIAAFYRDLGDQANKTTLVVMTEFGRTVRENGNRGTDHGHGGLMMVLGGDVKGGKVYGKWPGISDDQLWGKQDLQVTTDFRQVCGEAIKKRLKTGKQAEIFPDFKPGKKLAIL